MKNGLWLSADVKAHIEPTPIPLTKVELEELHSNQIIRVKMRRNPSQDTSETYNMNMFTFNDGQPEELLALLRKSKIAIDGTGTTTPTGRIKYLPTMLRGKSIMEFDKLSLQGNTANNHLK